MKPLLKIERARWWALSEQPFYAALAMRLSDALASDVPTAATDGATIRWNPEYVEVMEDEEVRYVLLHETLHCAHLHPWRLPATRRGNRAGDYAINAILRNIPGIRMPAGGLYSPEYEDMAEEEIFLRLPEEPGENDPTGAQDAYATGAGGARGTSADGTVGEDAADDPCGAFGPPADAYRQGGGATGTGDLRADWIVAVAQAAQAAQALGRGDLPGDLRRVLGTILATYVDWRRELADFVRTQAEDSNDWSRPARRHAWQRVIYPRRRRYRPALVVFGRDTSGSVSDQVCAAFSALISSCIAETQCRALILDCDAAIHAEHWLEPGDGCPQIAHGGGGTDFRPVFARARQLVADGETVAGVVYLTDLDGAMPDSQEFATLWVCTTDRVAPWGRTVRVHVED